MPHVTLAGNALKVNGVVINDPDRDATVKPIIWEIRRERRVELAMEAHRWFDLTRWGIAKEVLQAAGKNYQDKNALLPLPQTEIDKSNGVLVQNPDY